MTLCKVNISFKITKENDIEKSPNEIIESYKDTVLFLHGHLKKRKQEGKTFNIAETFLLNMQNAIEKAEFVVTKENDIEIFGHLSFEFEAEKEENLEDYIFNMLYNKHVENHKILQEILDEDIEKYRTQIDDSEKEAFEQRVNDYKKRQVLYANVLEYVKENIQIELVN